MTKWSIATNKFCPLCGRMFNGPDDGTEASRFCLRKPCESHKMPGSEMAFRVVTLSRDQAKQILDEFVQRTSIPRSVQDAIAVLAVEPPPIEQAQGQVDPPADNIYLETPTEPVEKAVIEPKLKPGKKK